MRELTFNTFFERFLPTIGKAAADVLVGSVEGERHCSAISDAVREAYEHDFWHGIILIEERTPDDGRLVARDESGETEIDTVQGFYPTEDNAREQTSAISAARTPAGWRLGASCTSVFVRFRPVAPVFTRTEHVAETVYATNDLTFLAATGKCYRARAESTGDAPATDVALWKEVPFPGFFETYVKAAAAAANSRYERQWEQAGINRSVADKELNRLRNVMKQG